MNPQPLYLDDESSSSPRWKRSRRRSGWGGRNGGIEKDDNKKQKVGAGAVGGSNSSSSRILKQIRAAMTNTAGAVGAVAAVLLVLYTFSSDLVPSPIARNASEATVVDADRESDLLTVEQGATWITSDGNTVQRARVSHVGLLAFGRDGRQIGRRGSSRLISREPPKIQRLLKIDTKLAVEDAPFLVDSSVAAHSTEGDQSLNKNVTWIDEKVLMEAEVFDWNLPGAGVLRRCQDPKCNGRGFCDYELGECRCNPGYIGANCEKTAFRECGPGLLECPPPGRCQEDVGLCFCGPETANPNRILPYSCKPKGMFGGRFEKWEIFGVNPNDPVDLGWCQEPSYAPWLPQRTDDDRSRRSTQCPCVADGYDGDFCDWPTKQYCLNDCSQHGVCNRGHCQCAEGYFGDDCSNSRNSLVQAHQVPSAPASSWSPKIYIYDLPPELDTHQLAFRPSKGWCAPRSFDQYNNTMWIYSGYALETGLHELLLRSPHRTLDPAKADFFYVPVYACCHIYPVLGSSKNPNYAPNCGIRVVSAMRLMKRAYDYVVNNFPYFNATQGKTHMFPTMHDEGACWAPKEVYANSIMITHWGRIDPSPHSTTAYPRDTWTTNCPPENNPGLSPNSTQGSLEEIGSHPCFNSKRDIVLPGWKHEPMIIPTKKCGLDRSVQVLFLGDLGANREENYSRGIRQAIAKLYSKKPNWKIGKHTGEYTELLCQSKFCLVLPGDGWSPRLEDAITHGCIPIIIQDGIFMEYEGWLDFSKFSVRVAESDVEKLHTIVEGFSPGEIRDMQENVAKVSIFFRWSSLHDTKAEDVRAIWVPDLTGGFKRIAPTVEDVSSLSRIPLGDSVYKSNDALEYFLHVLSAIKSGFQLDDKYIEGHAKTP